MMEQSNYPFESLYFSEPIKDDYLPLQRKLFGVSINNQSTMHNLTTDNSV